MAAVDQRLVDTNAKLIRLFTPPFDRGDLEPGYIKGYVPGIRENGGQYTHGVTWVVLAAALQGRGDLARDSVGHDRDPLFRFQSKTNINRVPCTGDQFRINRMEIGSIGH